MMRNLDENFERLTDLKHSLDKSSIVTPYPFVNACLNKFKTLMSGSIDVVQEHYSEQKIIFDEVAHNHFAQAFHDFFISMRSYQDSLIQPVLPYESYILLWDLINNDFGNNTAPNVDFIFKKGKEYVFYDNVIDLLFAGLTIKLSKKASIEKDKIKFAKLAVIVYPFYEIGQIPIFWGISIHEGFHLLSKNNNNIAKIYQELKVSDSKMEEVLTDLLSLYYLGPIYIFILKKHLDLVEVYPSKETHPSKETRIKILGDFYKTCFASNNGRFKKIEEIIIEYEKHPSDEDFKNYESRKKEILSKLQSLNDNKYGFLYNTSKEWENSLYEKWDFDIISTNLN